MGKWIVDGVDLSTVATNVKNRSAGFRVPGKRGDNLATPGRDGAIWAPNKPSDQGQINFNMWALGVMPDGSMPTNKTRALICRENLERILSLFADSSSLCEVVRVESAGYGAINQFPNPAAQGATPGGVGYENWVTNPAQVAQSTQETMRNIVTDPSLRTIGAAQTVAENIVQDPYSKIARASVAPTIATNYWVPPSYEEPGWQVGDVFDSGFWQQAANVTASVQPVVTKTKGDQVMRLIADTNLAANENMGKRSSNMFIPAGATMNFRMMLRRGVNTSTTRTIQLRVSFYNSDGTTINSSTAWSSGFTVPPNNTTWVPVTLPGTFIGVAPTNRMSVEFRTGEAWLAADQILIDAVSVSDDNTISGESAPYFDGDDPWAVWNTAVGKSLSLVRANIDTTWTPTGTRNAFKAYACSTAVDVAGSAIGFVAWRQTATSTQQFTLACAAPTIGKPYTLRFRARALVGVTATVELCSVEGGVTTSRGSVTVTGSAGSTAWDVDSGMTGATLGYQGPTWTPTSGQTLTVRVTVPVRADGHQSLQLTALAVTDFHTIRSGDTAPNSWSGTQWASKILLAGPQTTITSSRHLLNTGIAAIQNSLTMWCRNTGEATSIVLGDLPVQPGMLATGFTWQALVAATNNNTDNVTDVQPSVRLVAEARTTGGAALLATYTGTTVNPALPTTVGAVGAAVNVLVANTTLPATTAVLRVRAEMVNPLNSQTVDIGKLMLVSRYSASPLTYFDGASGGSWTGTANASASIQGVLGPTGYSVVQGVPVAKITGVNAINATSSGTSDVIFGIDIAAQPAGQYRVGVEVSCNVNVHVIAQAVQSGTVRSEQYLGYLYGQSTPGLLEPMQCVLDATNTFTQIRVILRPLASSTGQTMRLGRAYLFSIAASHMPRVSGNRLGNPYWLQQSKGWQLQSTGNRLSVVTTALGGKALQTTEAILQSVNTVPATVGQQIWVWARIQTPRSVQLRVTWYNSSDAALSTTLMTTSTPEDQLRTLQATATAPTSSAYGKIQMQMVNYKPGEKTNLYGAYASQSLPNRDVGDNLDPLLWAWFSGDSVGDYNGTDVKWTGTANASTSITVPQVPTWWRPGGPIVLSNPPYRPPGSVGNVVAWPGFANAQAPVGAVGAVYAGYGGGYTEASSPIIVITDPASTLTGRTFPIAAPYPFLSGEVAVARALYTSQVTVRVVGCDDDQGTNPIVRWTYRMTGLSEVVVWHDLELDDRYVYLEIEYVETAPNSGFAVIADNVALLNTETRLGVDYPGYFDGSMSSSDWTGEPHDSTSINYAGARRCYAEFVEPIGPESMAGGTRVEVDAVGVIPDAFWEDLAISTMTGTTSDPDTDFELTDFTGSTARNTSTTIAVKLTLGTAPPNFTLSDKKTGAWLRINHQMILGDVVTIDCAAFAVTLTRAGIVSSLAKQYTRGGASPLLALTPYRIDQPPVLHLACSPFDGIIQIDLTGRRKYVIA